MHDLAGGTSTDSLEAVGAACLARARGLIPLLRAAADRIEAANELPDDVLDAMFDAGMFKLLLPVAFGGFELRPLEYIQCVEAIAEGDASVAWCMNQGSGCSMAAAFMEPAVAREIWGGARDVVAWGQGPGTKAYRAAGGWLVTGTGRFASGSRHATWLGAMCPSFEADGTPIVRPDGVAWERTLLFRREKARIDDVWQVMGLRGTGSDNYTVEGLFVDDAHTLTREYAPERRQSGALYSFQAMQLYASGFASVALGISRAMLDAFVALARTKSQAWAKDSLRDNPAVQQIVSHADAAWKAARAGLHKAVEEAWQDVVRSGALSLEHRMEIRQAATYAIHVCRDIAHQVFHEAGSTAIFADQPFERRLRDVNSVSQQLQGRRTHFESVGLYRLGGEPDLRWI
jgi:alkylation response protein AidB-like acyl-CoA dehydrogenase